MKDTVSPFNRSTVPQKAHIIPFLTIEKIAMHGYGLGFHEGKAVFVPFTMPGDCVNVIIRIEKKDVIFGTVSEYHTSSDISINPGCDAFGGEHACGGCDWLMAPYNTQLDWKTLLVKENFDTIDLSEAVKPCIPSPNCHHYRNKSFLPAARTADGIEFGIFERYSHRVVPHQSCLLQPAVMDGILQEITVFAKQAKLDVYDEDTHKGTLRHVGIRINSTQNEILLILVTKGSKFPFTNLFIRQITTAFPKITGIIQNINRNVSNVILGDEDKLLYGNPYLNESLGDISYRLHYKSFMQINPGTTKLLYEQIKAYLMPDDVVLDAFCGIGSIGIYLAGGVKQVVGIEEVPEAIADAEYNVTLNRLDNASFILGKVESILPEMMDKYGFTTAILDPPRKGVEATALLSLAEHNIRQIIYVSCNPMTLVRDLRLLLEHGYQVEEITPFDMFPQTWHIETLARLTCKPELSQYQ